MIWIRCLLQSLHPRCRCLGAVSIWSRGLKIGELASRYPTVVTIYRFCNYHSEVKDLDPMFASIPASSVPAACCNWWCIFGAEDRCKWNMNRQLDIPWLLPFTNSVIIVWKSMMRIGYFPLSPNPRRLPSSADNWHCHRAEGFGRCKMNGHVDTSCLLCLTNPIIDIERSMMPIKCLLLSRYCQCQYTGADVSIWLGPFNSWLHCMGSWRLISNDMNSDIRISIYYWWSYVRKSLLPYYMILEGMPPPFGFLLI